MLLLPPPPSDQRRVYDFLSQRLPVAEERLRLQRRLCGPRRQRVRGRAHPLRLDASLSRGTPVGWPSAGLFLCVFCVFCGLLLLLLLRDYGDAVDVAR